MITYQGLLLTPAEFRDLVQTFLEHAERTGLLALDPSATCYAKDLYALYTRECARTQRVPGSQNAFGRALTALGSPIIRGTGGYAKRGGIKILEAPGS